MTEHHHDYQLKHVKKTGFGRDSDPYATAVLLLLQVAAVACPPPELQTRSRHQRFMNSGSITSVANTLANSLLPCLQLVLINISDHHTRLKANSPDGAPPPLVMGCLLGSQDGRAVDVANSFEIKFTEGDAGYEVDTPFLLKKQEQCEWQGVLGCEMKHGGGGGGNGTLISSAAEHPAVGSEQHMPKQHNSTARLL
jgi:hypothetical protein